MKRNHTNNRAAKSRPRGKYAEKRRANKQMYSQHGYTCCGNDPYAAIMAARRRI